MASGMDRPSLKARVRLRQPTEERVVALIEQLLDAVALAWPPEGGRVSLNITSESLLQDLLRFEQKGRQSELLEVMAGAVRHSSAVTIHLQLGEHVLALTVFPVHRLVHCVLPMAQFFELQLTDLEVLRVEKAHMQVPELNTLVQPAMQAHFAPLGKLLWELSLRGSRDELLPEISGQAAYRIAPGTSLRGLPLSGTMAEAVQRLKRHTTHLRDIAAWPGFDHPRAVRMLNRKGDVQDLWPD